MKMMRTKGFTLIELLVVVAIMGVIAAIAFPSYTGYMNKSRRSDAKVALVKMADRQERFYLDNDAYSSNESLLGGTTTPEGYYTVAATGSATGFSLTATAATGGPQVNDTGCTIMSISSTGLKTSAGSTTTDAAGCW